MKFDRIFKIGVLALGFALAGVLYTLSLNGRYTLNDRLIIDTRTGKIYNVYLEPIKKP